MPAERGQAMRRFLAVLVLALAVAASAGAQEIVIGQSVALSGANADIGRDMRDGALAVFAKANAGNALGGRRVKLMTLDNANSRERALENTQQLLSISKLTIHVLPDQPQFQQIGIAATTVIEKR